LIRSATAHCLRYDELWYSAFQISNYIITYDINITIQYSNKISDFDTLQISSESAVDLNKNKTVIARIIGVIFALIFIFKVKRIFKRLNQFLHLITLIYYNQLPLKQILEFKKYIKISLINLLSISREHLLGCLSKKKHLLYQAWSVTKLELDISRLPIKIVF